MSDTPRTDALRTAVKEEAMTEEAKQVGELDRKTYVGGSDVAAILGLSPFPNQTPLGAWLRKSGLTEPGPIDEAKEKIFRRGKRMEPLVIMMLEEDEGFIITKRSLPDDQNRYIDKEFDFMAAEVDFEWKVTQEMIDRFGLDASLLDTIQNGEVKTAHPWAAVGKFGESGTDEVDVSYTAQAMHGLGITGRRLCLFAVLVGSDNLSFYLVHRDEDTLRAMRARCAAFWRDNVLAKIAPPPVNLPDIYNLFRIKPASTTEATEELAALVEIYKGKTAVLPVIEQEIEDLKFKICEKMLGPEMAHAPLLAKPGTHILTVAGKQVLSVARQSRSGIDAPKMKKEEPMLAKRFEKVSHFFVIRTKKQEKPG